MEFKNSIPSFDILRHEYVARYVVLDPYMTGDTRFAFCEGDKECVLKQATKAKVINSLNVGDKEFYLNTKILGCVVDSYLKVDNKFYLVEESKQDYIVTEAVQQTIASNTSVELYSVPIYTNRKGKCCRIEFGRTVININGIELRVTDDTTIEDVLEYYDKKVICCYENGYLYFNGYGYSEDTDYVNFDEFPIESKLVSVTSRVKIANGDEILLFNEDIRGNLTTTVKKCKTTTVWNGFESVVYLDKLDNDYKYSQLRAYPAYFSQVLSLGRVRPFIPDICYATTFGDESKIAKGFILYNNDEQLNTYPIDYEYIPNVSTRPSDLWISMNVTYGKVSQKLPNLIFECDDNGIFQFKINTMVKENFLFSFSCDDECKLSIMDFDGNYIYTGSINDVSVKSSLKERTFTFKALPHSEIEFNYFGYDGIVANKIEYYFVAKHKNNARVEVNGLHLNQLLKPYEELIAIIGESSVGEGRIAL